MGIKGFLTEFVKDIGTMFFRGATFIILTAFTFYFITSASMMFIIFRDVIQDESNGRLNLNFGNQSTLCDLLICTEAFFYAVVCVLPVALARWIPAWYRWWQQGEDV
ncbi:hypothetical protein KVT40_008446 [Elsinoe batatas]|uniref:Uncharacterized protein n=1 Tax=Elsinoe batatas TaxID=2601811 RepID=A0A8K0KX06_9PEZI|nr:hypothetical protein KVT40_008446 [Elsinoe batatas]